jgi:hypothetical protein
MVLALRAGIGGVVSLASKLLIELWRTSNGPKAQY